MQTRLLVEMVQGAAYKDAVSMLEELLKDSNFKVVLKDLAAVLFTSQVLCPALRHSSKNVPKGGM